VSDHDYPPSESDLAAIYSNQEAPPEQLTEHDFLGNVEEGEWNGDLTAMGRIIELPEESESPISDEPQDWNHDGKITTMQGPPIMQEPVMRLDQDTLLEIIFGLHSNDDLISLLRARDEINSLMETMIFVTQSGKPIESGLFEGFKIGLQVRRDQLAQDDASTREGGSTRDQQRPQ
jgi:hypothetical protein